VKLIRVVVVASGAALCVSIAQGVRAQAIDEQSLEQQGLSQGLPAQGKWNVTLGAAVVEVPDYPGATGHRVRLRPLFSILYSDLVFVSPYGLGVNAIRVDGFRAGPIIGYEGGRSETSDVHLSGFGDIDPSLTAGAFAAWRPRPGVPFEISGTVRQAITHTSGGLNGLLRLDYTGHAAPEHWSLIGGPQLEFANREYQQTWFGVTPQQSENSGLPVYSPGGGLNQVGIHAAATYLTASHVLFRVFGEANRLTGDAAESPIVSRRTQLLVGVGAAYHF
jgi:outer membrane protein